MRGACRVGGAACADYSQLVRHPVRCRTEMDSKPALASPHSIIPLLVIQKRLGG